MPKVKKTPADVKTTSLQAFAAQLRAWRQQRGWSQVELGQAMGYSASLISGVESMDKPPTADFARACDLAFGTPGSGGETGTPGTFVTFYELVAREAYPAFFAPVVPFEREAVRIHSWELGSVPGLLQTEDYARSHMRSGRPQDSDSAIGKLVAARMERQRILSSDRPPLLWYVIDEGALRHMIGGAAVMGAQLDRLTEAAGLPGVVVQVLPFRAHDNAGADGAITIYESAEAPAVCYTECYSGGRIVEGRDEVAELMTVMSLIRASALSPHESLDLIGRIRSEI